MLFPMLHGSLSPRLGATSGRGDVLHIWRVAANILNNHSRTADKGGPTAWGLDVGLIDPHFKKQFVTNVTQGFGNGLCERPRRRKMVMRSRTWNIRSLYRAGLQKAVANESGRGQMGCMW